MIPENFPLSTTLIIGLGNPILGDDGVGWRVVEQVSQQLPALLAETADNPEILQSIEVDCLSLGGLALMERIVGYDRVIIVDALSTGNLARGSVYCFPLSDLKNVAIGHLSSAHDTTLQNAIEVGRLMGAPITQDITIVGIEANHTFDFSDELSSDMLRSIPIATEKVMELLR